MNVSNSTIMKPGWMLSFMWESYWTVSRLYTKRDCTEN